MPTRFCFGALLLAGLVLPLTSCSNSPSLTSITVSPSAMTYKGAGLSTQLTATGYYTHPNHPAKTEDITDQVEWASSTPECVTVNNTDKKGYITSGSITCTNIPVTASASGFNGLITGSMTVNVSQSSSDSSSDVTSITIAPSSFTFAVGSTQTFIATGITSSGVSETLTGLSGLVWSSGDTSYVSVNASTGVATAVAAGTTTVTATYTNSDGVTAKQSATVTAE
jgi:uncharacterized protein YjdB